jgi:hypothetical protein
MSFKLKPPRHADRHRSAAVFLAVIGTVCLGITSCKTTEKTAPRPAQPSRGEPNLSEIVSDLRANAEALRDFRAAATFTLTSPKIEAVQRFQSGAVAYRRPADLYVVGRNKLNVTLFKLTSHGPEFIIEFPTEQNVDDRYYCSFEGEVIANVPFPVAPADVAREMFMPIDWSESSEKEMRLVANDAAAGEATIEFDVKGNLVRRLVVQGKPWSIVHNTLTDRSGTTLSDTVMSNYIEIAGVRIPTNVDANFPEERTRIKFELRNVRINTGLPDSKFAIAWPPGQ